MIFHINFATALDQLLFSNQLRLSCLIFLMQVFKNSSNSDKNYIVKPE
jgi:hypothetical protein